MNSEKNAEPNEIQTESNEMQDNSNTETSEGRESLALKTSETPENHELNTSIETINAELCPGLNVESGRKVFLQAIEGISHLAKQYTDTDLESCKQRLEQISVSNDSEGKQGEEIAVSSELYEAYMYARDAGFTHAEFTELVDATHTGSLQELLVEKLKTETEQMNKRLEKLQVNIEHMEDGIRSYFEKMDTFFPIRRQSKVVFMGKYGSLALTSAEDDTLNVSSAGGRFVEETGAMYLFQDQNESEDEELSNKQLNLLVHERMHSLSRVEIPLQISERALQQEHTPGYEIGFSSVSEDGEMQYGNLNEAATEFFSRKVSDALGYEHSDLYPEETESFKKLLQFLSEDENKFNSEAVILKRYIESSGFSSMESEVEEAAGLGGLKMCNALLTRPQMLEDFLTNISALKNGGDTQPLEMSVDVLLNAKPPMSPQEIQHTYPFLELFTHVKDAKTQEWKKVPYTEEAEKENEISTEENQSMISEDEFFSVHEEVFKAGQAMRVDESARAYKERVEDLWKKRKEQLCKERQGVRGEERHDNENESTPEALEVAIREVYNKEYFARKGHLSDDLFAVSHGADPDSEEAVRLFESVSGEVGEHFDAHGIDKGSQVSNLLALLSSGVDSSKDFYTAPFELTNEKRQGMAAAVGTSGGTAYKGGFAVVTGGYGEKIQESGIKHVFINDVFKDAIPLIAERFPHVEVHALSEQKEVFEAEAKLSTIKDSK